VWSSPHLAKSQTAASVGRRLSLGHGTPLSLPASLALSSGSLLAQPSNDDDDDDDAEAFHPPQSRDPTGQKRGSLARPAVLRAWARIYNVCLGRNSSFRPPAEGRARAERRIPTHPNNFIFLLSLVLFLRSPAAPLATNPMSLALAKQIIRNPRGMRTGEKGGPPVDMHLFVDSSWEGNSGSSIKLPSYTHIHLWLVKCYHMCACHSRHLLSTFSLREHVRERERASSCGVTFPLAQISILRV